MKRNKVSSGPETGTQRHNISEETVWLTLCFRGFDMLNDMNMFDLARSEECCLCPFLIAFLVFLYCDAGIVIEDSPWDGSCHLSLAISHEICYTNLGTAFYVSIL